MYSLYAKTPFLDTSGNINGVNNLILSSSSAKPGKNNDADFHFIQFYRPYDTYDVNGD